MNYFPDIIVTTRDSCAPVAFLLCFLCKLQCRIKLIAELLFYLQSETLDIHTFEHIHPHTYTCREVFLEACSLLSVYPIGQGYDLSTFYLSHALPWRDWVLLLLLLFQHSFLRLRFGGMLFFLFQSSYFPVSFFIPLITTSAQNIVMPKMMLIQ